VTIAISSRSRKNKLEKAKEKREKGI